MERILHCNACHKMFDKQQRSSKFFVTACKHTFCAICAQSIASSTICADCKEPTEIKEINDKLPREIKDWFLDPAKVVQKHHRELMEILRFQQQLQNASAKLLRSKLQEALNVQKEAPMVEEEEQKALKELEYMEKRLDVMHRADFKQLQPGYKAGMARMTRAGCNNARLAGGGGRCPPGAGSRGGGFPKGTRCPSGIGRPISGIGRPNSGIGRPNSGIGRPNSGIGRPNSGIGRPDSGIGRPDSGIGRPDSGIGRPDSGIGRPDSGIGRPDSSIPPKVIGLPGIGFVKRR